MAPTQLQLLFYLFTLLLMLFMIRVIQQIKPTGIYNEKMNNVEYRIGEDSCSPVSIEEVVRQNSDPIRKVNWTLDLKTGKCSTKEECVPGFVNIKHGQYFWKSPATKTVVCQIKKNMSQLLQAIFCFLSDELDFLYSAKSLVRDVFDRGCRGQRRFGWKDAFRAGQGLKEGWKPLAVVRDPVDRILSAFLYFCVTGELQAKHVCEKQCHGCGVNLTCFLENQFILLKKMSFSPANYGHVTEHVYPQTYRCDFANHLENYTLLKYHPNPKVFFPSLKKYLKSRNVTQRSIHYIYESMTRDRTPHSTVLLQQRQFLEDRLRRSSYLLDLVVRMFYHDFKTFGFPIPKFPINE